MSDRTAGDRPEDLAPSAPGPLSVSTLRHDLKTAVNHIRGYAELLIDEAEDQGWDGLIFGLRDVVKNGGVAAVLIDNALPTGPEIQPDLAGLCLQLSPLADTIRDRCATLTREADPTVAQQITEDLNRVVIAANRLGQLLDRECRVALGEPSECPIPEQETTDENPAR